jgi:glycosyltransferase involved in cell wall biosynthesis
MKIGIDARFYGPEGKGLGRYVQKLIENLEKIDDGSHQYYIFLRKDNFNSYIPRSGNFKKVLADFKWYSWGEQFRFPFLLNRFNLDLMHFCHFNMPWLYKGKFVVTIHDLILFHYPTTKNTTRNKIHYFLKFIIYKFIIKSAAKRAQKIITVSNFTKQDIVNELKISEKKVIVTLEGCEVVFKKNVSITEDNKYKKFKPFLLYVGNAYPHKNLERFCRAFLLIRKRYPNLKLLLVGEKDFFYERLQKFINDNNIQNIHLAGFVSDEELDIIYREALLYVFPSLYEGFGLPPLEAMVRQVPVVSSDRTSMPEILGFSAHYFNPEDVEGIAKSVIEMIDSVDEWKGKIIKESPEILKKFSWLDMAKKTKKVYKNVLKNKE